MESYGKLILIQENAPEQEFELFKSNVTLGRAMTNDIVLNDSRVSRNHAGLNCGPQGCTVFDLGSSNGTRLNDVHIEMAKLKPGDTISVGNSLLRFEAGPVIEGLDMTMIDSEADLNQTIDQAILPVAINETRIPRLVIFSGEKTWDVPLDEVDQVAIGRAETNPVVIEQEKVSRQHAEVIRKGSLFVLRDLGSTNGTWFKGEKVGEMVLQDGDSFRIGGSQIIFKSGFADEALTIADESLARRPNRRPVVFVPGLMGSELWLGNERVWPNLKFLFKNPEIFRFPSQVPLEPRAIVDEVVIVPNLIKQDQYNRLGDYMVEDLGYQRNVDFFEFPYDWRQDVRKSARQLGELINTLPHEQPVTLIGHSLGTMVSRYYIERLGGKERVDRVILMGGPHQGTIKILNSLLIAPQVLPFGIMGERMRQIIETFETCYQIIPVYPVGVDQSGEVINFLEDETWAKPEQIPLLRAGRQFRQELGRRSSIPAISIFGYGLKTLSGVTLQREADGKLSNFTFQTENAGDSTILEKSAVLENTDIHPVQQYHGSLFVDNDVKMRLKVELAKQFSS
jgi:pSer/pThr/pTyr-binding forkhead associated (FHA) protein